MKKLILATISLALTIAVLLTVMAIPSVASEEPAHRQVGDFDHDGRVTSADAIYLLRATLFPDDFPLCDHSDAYWVIITEPTDDSEGEKQLICRHCGAVLDSKVIPKAAYSAGKSAYELAVEEGFDGTLQEWLDSLKGVSVVGARIDSSTHLILVMSDGSTIDAGYVGVSGSGEPGHETTDPTISVGSASAAPGGTVRITVTVKNNPGVAGALLKLSFDSGLTLKSASAGAAFNSLQYTAPGKLTNPCNFSWDSESGMAAGDGVVLNLEFAVSSSARSGSELNVSCSYKTGDIYDEDLNDVDFTVENGIITIE